MTRRAIFAALIDQIFGKDSATFDTSADQSNHVIDALAHPTEFTNFKSNFKARLQRLNTAIQIDASLRKEILYAVNRIVDSGWDGAYAELCALDYFLAEQRTGPGRVFLDHTVPASETLASEMGMQNANHDLSFPELGVSIDTKLLSDKTGDILKGIFNDYCSTKGISNLLIVPSYDPDSTFEQFVTSRSELLTELVNKVDPAIQPATLQSSVIPGLSYSLAWGSGVYFGEGSYSPEEHARNHHSLLFGHAKKFSRLNSTIIVFVIFPWSAEKVFLFKNLSQTFFQALGEIFFNDYINSCVPAKKFNKKFQTMISASEVTRHLSGVIYLEDQTITSTDSSLLNISANYILNEHAIHPLFGHEFELMLKHRGAYNLNRHNNAG
ncbi:TPA: hypothetical protein ACKP6A_002333 [Pseudomonas aeruginosa]|uniref:hypothetical protein n=3 Tax=Pseudomonas aeruginosa TaxID=287 RepID=UPI0003B9EBAF|nr:hypothetical protein [Pseudomonas aeruginosa]ERY84288.1 hypothetical protein Q028_00888 [Pseudomonas aeruginosa BWHPSA015]MBA4919732.1 hypothetical protein [Pseudomonas aeruginosa]MBA5118290.1 hypothetical protein [Pseudomonas aeruginosa]MBG4216057.1 hypothetical protein [Pseudomonas aeruginosa]MBH3491109.1 hypothetical protein [Pseudomonas aeruginosa]